MCCPFRAGARTIPRTWHSLTRRATSPRVGRPAAWRRDPGEVSPLLIEWDRYGYVAPPMTCSVGDCDRRPDSHGMCQQHRRRVMKYGTTELPDRPTVCSVDGCAKPVNCKGRCKSHYRVYLRGDQTCSWSERTRPLHTRRLCRRHYQDGWISVDNDNRR